MPTQTLRLTTRKILAWADAHFQRTGRWPTYRSGHLLDAPEQNWSAIDGCLEFGGLGLPGGSSLAFLLAQHRGLIKGPERPPLSIPLILVWADRHQIRTGDYPARLSGRVAGARGETWSRIDRALREGDRGLAGGRSLEELLAKHRGKALERQGVKRLAIDEILTWVDEHRARTGFWPKIKSGPIQGQPGESWVKIDAALRYGLRGLPGGSSIALLLAERRGKMFRERRRHLTFDRILDWADQHRRRTGDWPTQNSGAVHGEPGESWKNIDDALLKGRGGLPGGLSLPTLLARRRGRRHMGQLRPLTVAGILAWADEHHRRTGKWPSEGSGPVIGAPEESWRNINAALQRGGRGLRVKKSLAELLAESRGKTPKHQMPRLSISRVLTWADRHRAQSGDWPTPSSGNVVDAPENTWEGINSALVKGYRGLPGGSSLARLLAERRRKWIPTLAPRLTVTRILHWADSYHRRTGKWPIASTEPIENSPDDSWRSIDNALRQGHRGLEGGTSLARLLLQRRQVRRGLSPRPLDRKHAARGRTPMPTR